MISCNDYVIHAVTQNGQLFSWGSDRFRTGVLGLGKSINEAENPILVQFNGNRRENVHIKLISTGESHAGAIDSNQNIYFWGDNKYGQSG